MRILIEEFGHTAIALAIAAIMITVLIIGVFLPEMQFYVMTSVPENFTNVDNSFAQNFNRQNPIIDSPSYLIVNAGTPQIDFDDYISDKTIKAINADGVDISSNIVIKTEGENIKPVYNESSKIFDCSELEVGYYNFVISVIDYTDTKYYGKITEKDFTIFVVSQ